MLEIFVYQGSRKVEDLLETENIYTGKEPAIHLQRILENTFLPSVSLSYGDFSKTAAQIIKSISYRFNENNLTAISRYEQTPDLNPIKNIWLWVDRKIVTTHITSVKYLQEKLEKTCLNTPHKGGVKPSLKGATLNTDICIAYIFNCYF